MSLQRAKTFLAAGAVLKNTFAMGTATAQTVDKAAALTSPIIGVFSSSQPDAGQEVDVIYSGEAKLILGGSVNIGDRLTSDTNGYGVAISSGVSNVGAIALAKGASGDLIPVDVQLSQCKLS